MLRVVVMHNIHDFAKQKCCLQDLWREKSGLKPVDLVRLLVRNRRLGPLQRLVPRVQRRVQRVEDAAVELGLERLAVHGARVQQRGRRRVRGEARVAAAVAAADVDHGGAPIIDKWTQRK